MSNEQDSGSAEVDPDLPVKRVIRTPSKVVSIADDIAFGVLADIAKDAGVNVFTLTFHPLMVGYGGYAEPLYRAACAVAGDPPPEKVTLGLLRDAYDSVPDDFPTMWVDGLPPEDGQTTP